MTTYFEVLERDGPARLGELRLSSSQLTPALADDCVVDAGGKWATEQAHPEPTADAVTILPHRGLPAGTPEAVASTFGPEPISFDGPAGIVINEDTAADLGADLYVLSGATGCVGHAAAFVETLIEVKAAIPPDAALYLPGVATPANVSVLAYAGVDLVDTHRVQLAGSEGRYLRHDGSYEMDEWPTQADRSDVIASNIDALSAELATVRARIRRGTLRDYVSAQCRHCSWLTATLRRLDEEYTYLEQHEPLFRRSDLTASTDDDLHRPCVNRYLDRVGTRYRSRFRTPLVLLPCSASKPYSQSQSHRQFRRAISFRAHRVAISSPMGVVPQELECTYPAQQYDIPVTGRWSPTERSVIGDSLHTYLSRHEYPRVIAHVPPGAYRELVETAAKAVGIDVTYTVDDHPTTSNSLAALEEELAGELKYSRRDRRHHTVRAIADYQFGAGAGEQLFPTIEVEAPYPKHRVLDSDGTHLATMVPEYGLLAFTLAGARHWEASAVDTRSVEIDDFVPHGDVLAPGILAADEEIRPGDEVVVTGPSAYGVGRALMHGRELRESTRGVAVDLRHSEER